MYYIALLTISLGLLIQTSALNAHAKYIRLGDFDIVASGRHGGFILDDGNTYKPLSDFQKNRVHSWQLGDSILVLRISHTHKYLLINTSNGQKAKCKITVKARLPLS
jgi:hypothetical protein